LNGNDKEETMELTQIFGSNVFNDKVMKKMLPKQIYSSLKETIERDAPLRPDIADIVLMQ